MVPFAEKSAAVDDRVKVILRDMKLRGTPMRRAVLRLLLDAGHPISASDLLHKIPHGELVTIYRTLEAFTAKGIVHKVRSKDREWLFAMGTGVKLREHLHPHFICEQCGAVECLSTVHLPKELSVLLNLGRDYRVSYAEVLLRGRCARCQPPTTP